VNTSGVSIILTSNNNPSTFEQTVTFKAKLSSQSTTPTGSVSFYDGTTSLGNFSLVGDSAEVSTASLTAGSHTIKCFYSGDSNFNPDSTTITQTVNKAAPAVTLTSSLNPSVFGQNVSFKAKVDNASHPPTGSVTFYDGAASLGSVSLVGDSAEVSTANLAAGTHTIKCVYSGDSNFNPDSTSIVQTVNTSGVSIALTSNNNPSTFEQTVTFKAKLFSQSTTPTGNVSFYDGATPLGNFSLVGDSAEVSTANLTAGSHTIKCVYSGDSNFNPDSTTITQTVNKAAPAVTLTSSLNPSVFGQNVSFKAKVDNASHTPTGSVTFYDGAASLGNISLVGDSALASTSALSAGIHTIKAVYSGDGNFRDDSVTIAQTVNQAGSAVTLTSSLNPSTFEQNVTFKAKLSSQSSTPTGNVIFYDGTTSLGSASLVGDSAEVSTPNLTAGSHTVKCVYSGDSNFNPDSATIAQTVNRAAPTVALTSSLNPSVFGQNVSFKAKVDNASHTPTGSVTFYDGAVSLGSFSMSGDSAEVSTAALVAGGHTIKAVYSGDSNFNPDSTTIVQTVNQAAPAVTLTSSVNPSTFEQNVTFKAKLSSQSGTPSGSVTFYDGTTSLGSASLVGDSAEVSTANLAAGNHTIKCVYSGDSNFNPDSTTITQTVNKAAPAVTLTSSLNPSVFGQNVSFKAKVDNASHTPTGSVTFYDGAASLGNVSLVGDSAEVSTANLTAGSHTIKCVYSGNSNFNPDSTTIIQTVRQAAPAVTLTSSLNPSVFGQNVTFKAKVSSQSGTPTGSVSFYDGAASLGSASLVGDSAEVSTANLTAGTHTIKCVYSGDSNFDPDSVSIVQTVNQATPVVTLASSLNPSTFGQNVTFKAKVDNANHTPTGTVSFYDGAASLGSASLVGDSVAVSTANLAAGSHTVKAVYSGDSNFNPDSASIVQSVNQASPTVTLASSLNPSTFGQNVTFKAKVGNASHTPTGSVSFYDGATSMGSVFLIGDSAEISTAALVAGIHSIKAVYSGDNNFRSDSASLSQTVNKKQTTSTLRTTPNPSIYGQSITLRDSVSGPPNGGKVYFKIDGIVIDSGNVNGGGIASISISSLATGTHSISARFGGTNDFDTSESNTINQIVNRAPTSGKLTSSRNPSVYTQTIVLKDSISGGVLDGGTIQFMDGINPLGSPQLFNAHNVATLSVATLTVGTHTLRAIYSGSSNFLGDTSNALLQLVNREPTTSTLTQSSNVTYDGGTVTFRDSVAGSVPDGGTVQFKDGGTDLGNPIPINGNGIAELSISTLSLGVHALTAFYSGTSTFDSSISNRVSHVVARIDSSFFRTARYKDWTRVEDQHLLLLSTKREADNVEFELDIVAPRAATGFSLWFNMLSRGTVNVENGNADTLIPNTPWNNVNKVTYTAPVESLETFHLSGRGFIGKLFRVRVVWQTSPITGSVTYQDVNQFRLNQLRLPMPNLNNVGEELFPNGFGQPIVAFPNGLLVGVPIGEQGGNSINHLTFKDVRTSLIKRTSNGYLLHTDYPRCLDAFDRTFVPIYKQERNLPPSRHNNKLFAEVLALKLNIAASVFNKFPNGLGELTFVDPSDPANPFNGMMVNDIIKKADTLLSCSRIRSGPRFTPAELYSVVRRIDSAFVGPIDTISFATKTVLTGVRRLNEVPFLYKTEGIVPLSIIPPDFRELTPVKYELYQNYPNPFNPSTTIQFYLADPSIVTLKVYNVLGQEVATLFDGETLDEGLQNVQFDARNFASGVYFYRMVARGIASEGETAPARPFTEVKKMMLLK
jgi:hypothetical protein